ncbi:MAG: hypothetical protein ACXAAO_09520 [Candidatus Thorarchaeota archaeon]
MQLTLYSMLTFVIFLQALLLQTFWLYIGRRARDRYLYDIMHFRKPASTMSRYYHWRVTQYTNAVLEGILFQFILVGSLVIVSVLIADLALFMNSILFVVFVMLLSFISSIQMALRVREINTQESRIVAAVGSSIDKFSIARDIVENLFIQGSMGDGRVWFALYRIAQEPNQIGYIIRDVLIEKNKEVAESLKYTKRVDANSTSGSGPDIES